MRVQLEGCKGGYMSEDATPTESPETAAAPPPSVVDFEMVGTNEQLCALYEALSAAKAEFGNIVKNQKVDVYKKDTRALLYTYTYADLEELLDKTTPALSKHGLGVIWPLSATNVSCIRVMLFHKGGARIVSIVGIPNSDDIKDWGGDITFSSRYAYRALLGIGGGEDRNQAAVESRGEGAATQATAGQAPQQPRREEPRRTPPGPQNRSGGERSESRPTTTPTTRDSGAGSQTKSEAASENPPARNPFIGGGQTAAPTGSSDSASSSAAPSMATATAPSQPSAAGSPAPGTSGPASAGSTAPATSSEPGKLNEMQKNLLGQLARRAGATTVDEFTAMIRDICSALPLVNGMVPRANADNFEYICKQLKALEKPGA